MRLIGTGKSEQYPAGFVFDCPDREAPAMVEEGLATFCPVAFDPALTPFQLANSRARNEVPADGVEAALVASISLEDAHARVVAGEASVAADNSAVIEFVDEMIVDAEPADAEAVAADAEDEAAEDETVDAVEADGAADADGEAADAAETVSEAPDESEKPKRGRK